MIHGCVGRRDVTPADEIRGVTDAGLAFARVGEPEECQGVALADVEEEVLAHPVRQLDGLGQRHAQDA